MLHDRFAIDRVADRAADFDAFEDPVLQVQPEIGVVAAGRGRDAEPALGLQLPHDVRSEVVDDEIDRALAQLEAAHRIVRHHLQHDAGVAWRAAIVVRERLQYEPIVLHEFLEPIGAGAVRRPRVGGAGVLADDAHDQVDGERGERLLQRELDGVGGPSPAPRRAGDTRPTGRETTGRGSSQTCRRRRRPSAPRRRGSGRRGGSARRRSSDPSRSALPRAPARSAGDRRCGRAC